MRQIERLAGPGKRSHGESNAHGDASFRPGPQTRLQSMECKYGYQPANATLGGTLIDAH